MPTKCFKLLGDFLIFVCLLLNTRAWTPKTGGMMQSCSRMGSPKGQVPPPQQGACPFLIGVITELYANGSTTDV